MNKDDEMSNTFVAEVGQKSAIFNPENNDQVESLEETVSFPEVKIDPPKDMPSVLEADKPDLTKKEEENDDEEEFLESKKKKKNKKYKKRNPFTTFLIIIICLALGAGGSYYYFEIFNKTDSTEVNKSEANKNSNKEIKNDKNNEIEEIEPTSIFAKKLIERYDNSVSSSQDAANYEILYAKDKTTPANFSADYIQVLGVANIRSPFYFSKEQLDESLTELFGKDKFKAREETIDYGTCKYYENANGYYQYKEKTGCGGTSAMSMKRKIVKVEKDNNKLYINVAIEITAEGNVYKAYDITNAKGVDQLTDYTYETFDIEKDYAKLNQYKYTFDFDKDNNNYYLESIELVK